MSKKCKVICCTIAVLLLVPAVVSSGGGSGAEGCYAIIVGKEASVDGSVILAHNEDDGPPQVVNHHKVPRMNHPPGAEVTLINGGKLDQVEQTWSYLWSEMPGLLFSDSYLNEWGVCITSDACRSREDKPVLTDGGISYMLRRLVAERARSAREGVHIAATLVERFGYDGSGRTYSICDPDEGWLFCVVNGKHWLASRVPDDQVACIANTYSVRQVNLGDTMNCLASDDIVEYAIQRGWYDPDVDGPFDFAAAYADPETASDIRNYARQWSGLRLISADPIELSTNLPTTVTPKQRMDVAMVMEILRDHYEGTELDVVDSASGNPHDAGVWTICNTVTQTSFVAQLRRDMPLETGLCWWICLGSPCQSVYVPFHFGISQFPESYVGESRSPSQAVYEENVSTPAVGTDPDAFWLFKSVGYHTSEDYANRGPEIKAVAARVERVGRSRRSATERAMVSYVESGESVGGRLAGFSDQMYRSAEKAMTGIVASWLHKSGALSVSESEVKAVHLRNLGYHINGEARLLAQAFSPNCKDVGGGPHGTGEINVDEASLETLLASKTKLQSLRGKPLDDIVDTSNAIVLTYEEIVWSRFRRLGQKVGFRFEKGDVLAEFPPGKDWPGPDEWFAVYRMEDGEWKIIAVD